MKDDCIFCKLANGIIPTRSIYEDENFKVILDAAPAARPACLSEMLLQRFHCGEDGAAA